MVFARDARSRRVVVSKTRLRTNDRPQLPARPDRTGPAPRVQPDRRVEARDHGVTCTKLAAKAGCSSLDAPTVGCCGLPQSFSHPRWRADRRSPATSRPPGTTHEEDRMAEREGGRRRRRPATAPAGAAAGVQEVGQSRPGTGGNVERVGVSGRRPQDPSLNGREPEVGMRPPGPETTTGSGCGDVRGRRRSRHLPVRG